MAPVGRMCGSSCQGSIGSIGSSDSIGPVGSIGSIGSTRFARWWQQTPLVICLGGRGCTSRVVSKWFAQLECSCKFASIVFVWI